MYVKTSSVLSELRWSGSRNDERGGIGESFVLVDGGTDPKPLPPSRPRT